MDHPTEEGPKAELRKLGAHLAKLREDRGLTQPQLAKKMGRSTNSISRWETGKQQMGALDAVAAAAALGISVGALLTPGEAPEQLRTTSLYFTSPELLERLRLAKTRRQVMDLLPQRPPVGVVIEPGDVQVGKEQYEATMREAAALFDAKSRGWL